MSNCSRIRRSTSSGDSRHPFNNCCRCCRFCRFCDCNHASQPATCASNTAARLDAATARSSACDFSIHMRAVMCCSRSKHCCSAANLNLSCSFSRARASGESSGFTVQKLADCRASASMSISDAWTRPPAATKSMGGSQDLPGASPNVSLSRATSRSTSRSTSPHSMVHGFSDAIKLFDIPRCVVVPEHTISAARCLALTPPPHATVSRTISAATCAATSTTASTGASVVTSAVIFTSSATASATASAFTGTREASPTLTSSASSASSALESVEPPTRTTITFPRPPTPVLPCRISSATWTVLSEPELSSAASSRPIPGVTNAFKSSSTCSAADATA
mmetsp:Transcript_35563/g.80765  ORF Transcript_35563/g.80765 Transcript_35563/m.80765 type:complete len:337 (-) Transcript_35563:65-1075(-)